MTTGNCGLRFRTIGVIFVGRENCYDAFQHFGAPLCSDLLGQAECYRTLLGRFIASR